MLPGAERAGTYTLLIQYCKPDGDKLSTLASVKVKQKACSDSGDREPTSLPSVDANNGQFTVELQALVPDTRYCGTLYAKFGDFTSEVCPVEFVTSSPIDGIEPIFTEKFPVRYYNLQGVPTTNPTPGRIYIKRSPNSSTVKILPASHSSSH